MTIDFKAPLGAICIVLASAGVGFASPAIVLSTDIVVREGPGEQYKPIWELPAGTHVDVRECNKLWCRVVRRDKEGWTRLKGLDLYPGRGADYDPATGGGSSSNSSQTAQDQSTTTGGKTPGSRKSASSGNNGNEGISPIDGASMPGAGRTSSSSSGGNGGSSGNESIATEAATVPKTGSRF